jgi:hypothetical protein
VRGFSISERIGIKDAPYAAGVRLRYSRSVEFDFTTESYALVEGFEIIPEYEARGSTTWWGESIGPYLGVGRPARVVVRRANFPSWRRAFFARVYRLSLVPITPDKALLMEPGDSVSMHIGVGLFVGPRAFNLTGDAPSTVGAGLVLPAEYAITVERLADPEVPGEEWVLSVGGTIRRYLELSARLRTPKVLIKRFRVLDVRFKPLSRGLQFSFFSPALDLRRTPAIEPIYSAVMRGVARFPDFKLWGQTFRLFLRPEITMDTMSRMQDLAEFRRLLEPERSAAASIAWSRALTGVRGHEDDVRFWILFYRTTWNFDQYDGETLLDPRASPPVKFFHYLTRRSRHRSWIFFPREGYDLEVVTMQDFETGRLVTEATFEIQDRHEGAREGLRYRRAVKRFLGTRLVSRFPVEPPPRPSSAPDLLVFDGLPDLDREPLRKEKVSFALRLVLGSRYHGGALGDGEIWDPEDRKHRTVHGRAVHRRLREALFGIRPAMDDLFGIYGARGDLYASFHIELQPIGKEADAKLPVRLYRGSTGNPGRDVQGYGRLRRAFDSAQALF